MSGADSTRGASGHVSGADSTRGASGHVSGRASGSSDDIEMSDDPRAAAPMAAPMAAPAVLAAPAVPAAPMAAPAVPAVPAAPMAAPAVPAAPGEAADVSQRYELFSILMHSGSALAGHYFAYIYEPDRWLLLLCRVHLGISRHYFAYIYEPDRWLLLLCRVYLGRSPHSFAYIYEPDRYCSVLLLCRVYLGHLPACPHPRRYVIYPLLLLCPPFKLLIHVSHPLTERCHVSSGSAGSSLTTATCH